VSAAPLVTVVEAPEFIRRTDKLLSDGEREELIGYLAANPTATASTFLLTSTSKRSGQSWG
jgi:hypothetical protein